MGTYIVVADNCVAGTKGSTVTDEQLGGCNVAALVAGGTLSPIAAPPVSTPAAPPATAPLPVAPPPAPDPSPSPAAPAAPKGA